MLPMGRFADIIGRKKVHLIGLIFFASGSVFTALAPSFGLLILARIVTAIGNSMGQSVGTAMVLSVFPARERGKAIGAQTTSVAIGGAMGPVIAGIVLQFLPWQSLFLILTIPIGIAFIAGYFILDEKVLSQQGSGIKPSFDWMGAIVSGVMIIIVVILINNPFDVAMISATILGGIISQPQRAWPTPRDEDGEDKVGAWGLAGKLIMHELSGGRPAYDEDTDDSLGLGGLIRHRRL